MNQTPSGSAEQHMVEKQALMKELAYFISCAKHQANPAKGRVAQAERMLKAIVEKND